MSTAVTVEQLETENARLRAQLDREQRRRRAHSFDMRVVEVPTAPDYSTCHHFTVALVQYDSTGEPCSLSPPLLTDTTCRTVSDLRHLLIRMLEATAVDSLQPLSAP
jgi:hypothetical protein